MRMSGGKTRPTAAGSVAGASDGMGAAATGVDGTGVAATEATATAGLVSGPASVPLPRRETERGEATRLRILEAARPIARARGYHGTSLAMIQKAAHVHPGSLYWHFEDKDALFAALIQYGYEQTLTEAAHADVGHAVNPVLGVLRSLADNPARYGLWRFNVEFMLDPDMRDSKTAQVIRQMRVDSQNAMTRAWLDRLPPEVVAAHPELPRRMAEEALVCVEGCILARVADRTVDEEAITQATTASLDALVERACLEAGVPVPEFIESHRNGAAAEAEEV